MLYVFHVFPNCRIGTKDQAKAADELCGVAQELPIVILPVYPQSVKECEPAFRTPCGQLFQNGKQSNHCQPYFIKWLTTGKQTWYAMAGDELEDKGTIAAAL